MKPFQFFTALAAAALLIGLPVLAPAGPPPWLVYVQAVVLVVAAVALWWLALDLKRRDRQEYRWFQEFCRAQELLIELRRHQLVWRAVDQPPWVRSFGQLAGHLERLPDRPLLVVPNGQMGELEVLAPGISAGRPRR